MGEITILIDLDGIWQQKKRLVGQNLQKNLKPTSHLSPYISPTLSLFNEVWIQIMRCNGVRDPQLEGTAPWPWLLSKCKGLCLLPSEVNVGRLRPWFKVGLCYCFARLSVGVHCLPGPYLLLICSAIIALF